MSGLAVFAFAVLAAAVSWERTPQRFGTLDEVRAILAAVAAYGITTGAWVLTQ